MLQPTPAEFLAQLKAALDEGEAMLEEAQDLPSRQIITEAHITDLKEMNERLRKLISSIAAQLPA